MLENEAAKLYTENNIYSKYALDVYKYLNKEHFEDFETLDLFKPTLDLIFECHRQNPKITYKSADIPIFNKESKQVLLCCSGGLDSVYQALKLRELGYDVILMHLNGANFYENGQAYKVFKEFATKFKYKTYEPKISPKHKGDYKKFWSENSFKDFLIYSIAIDYMIEHNIRYLSAGDDLRLDMKDQVTGVNTGDARQLTEAFMKSFDVEFIPVDKTVDKAQRLAYLEKYDARDYYLSCVGPGRLIKSQHERYEKRFNIKTDKWCCFSCRKCAFHLLADHYYNNKPMPQELIDRCWDKISIGADEAFFGKHLDLQTRIKNLKDY